MITKRNFMKIIYRKWKDLWLSMIQLTPQYIQPTIIGSTVSSCPPDGCCLWYWSIHFLMNFCSIWRASLTDWGSYKIRYKIRNKTKKLFSLKRLWRIWQILLSVHKAELLQVGISWHELVLAGNQINHQKLVPFI